MQARYLISLATATLATSAFAAADLRDSCFEVSDSASNTYKVTTSRLKGVSVASVATALPAIEANNIKYSHPLNFDPVSGAVHRGVANGTAVYVEIEQNGDVVGVRHHSLSGSGEVNATHVHECR